jgi:Zn-dependent metalloprotease
MVDQHHLGETAESASWLIGADVLAPDLKGALRSMKAPGSAYDNTVVGKDPQPAHMKNYLKTATDSGGVHINSGIPNHAFYLAAISVGGYSWEKVGRIWMKSMDRITPSTDFAQFASITFEAARDLYGHRSDEAKAVARAWSEVGINVTKPPPSRR